MEDLYYNLSEEDSSKGRNILLWIFAGIFFIAGSYVLFQNFILGEKSISPTLAIAPYAICLVVSIIAAFATIKRKNLFFSINADRIEFRYGILYPKERSFNWADIKEIVMSHRQNKILIRFKNRAPFIINLSWLKREKASRIKKHLYNAAKEKNPDIIKVIKLIK
ncbi:MAG: hypothetical protein LLG13_13710 [Bacteroidales bacterium]|nr:hypothetical protein [Bacteroidales bacterium]